MRRFLSSLPRIRVPSSAVVPSGGAGAAAPAAPGAAPLPALQASGASQLQRRSAVELLVHAPRAPERVPIVEQVRQYTFHALGFALALALLAVYAASREHSPGADLARMQAAVAWLRRARARARAALLGAAQEQGQVPLEGGSGGRVLKWWASGPRAAPRTVLLAAEDGESAAVWGEVHARLAAALGARARIVSYHCAGADGVAVGGSGSSSSSSSSSSGSAAGGGAAPQAALLLRVRNAEAVLEAAAGVKPGSSRGSSRSSGGRGVVHVHAGAGAWAALALAALHPARTAGVVLVAPLLYHRQRVLAWVDAVPAASRVPSEVDPGLLQRLLEPPPVPSALPGGALAPAVAAALDAAHPRRKDMAGFWERFGTAGARTAAASRFAEDFRRWRSRQMVLSAREVALVRALAPGVGGSSSSSSSSSTGAPPAPAPAPRPPALRALTWGQGALPSWMDTATARASVAHFVLAAVAAGAMLAPGVLESQAGGAAAAAAAAAAATGRAPRPDGAPPDLVVKVRDEAEARHVGALLGGLPAALGLGRGALLASVDLRLAQLAAELEALPRNFTVTLVEGGEGEGGGGGGGGGVGWGGSAAAVGSQDLAVFPLQCPEAIVREVLAVLEGEEASAGAAAAAAAAAAAGRLPGQGFLRAALA